MKSAEIIRENIALHIGYQLSDIATSDLTVQNIEEEMGMKPFKTIPHKITAFLRRSLIARAWKSRCFGGPLDYYLVEAVDGTIFHLNY